MMCSALPLIGHVLEFRLRLCGGARRRKLTRHQILERHIITYTRQVKPNLLVADFTGVNLKALGLNNDLCSSEDYTGSMAISSALHEVELESKVARLIDHPDYDDLLSLFNVAILPSGRAP